MPKKLNRVQYGNISDKKEIISNDSKSKRKLKIGSSEFIYNKYSGNKKNQDIYFEDDEIKDEEVTSRHNYWYRGELMKLVPNALQEIMEAKEVVVEQKIELMEVLTGCETPNRYNVYLLDRTKQKKFLFKCKEESNWFCRNCLPSSYRSFYLKMTHIISSNKKTDYKKSIADFERPFRFTCFCCCRPNMTCYFKGDDQDNQEMIGDKNTRREARKEKIGNVIEPFGCAPELLIYGTDGQIRWKIYGEYCQCGFWARDISVGKCYEVDFWIYDSDADVSKVKPVGNIHKVFKGLSELVTDSDAFILTFPKNATSVERLLLIGSVIMIDYRYYEDLACCDLITLL